MITNGLALRGFLLLLLLGKLWGCRWLWWRLLGPLDQYRPILGNGQTLIDFRSNLGRSYVHCDRQLACGPAPEHALGGRHVGIVPSDCGADVPVSSYQVVCGIKTYPAELRQERFDPRMGRSVR